MTFIELTVVILVLISLVSILFAGAKAWIRGSDRAAKCHKLAKRTTGSPRNTVI